MPILQSRRFAPRPWAVLLWLALTVAMLFLARWQLVRADEKIALIEAAEAARAAEPIAASALGGPGLPDAVHAASEYRRLSATGTWLPERQFLWDNRSHGGRPGLEVVTPLLLGDGRAVLVNRGWMPLPMTRQALPDVGVSDARVTLTGLASRPSRGFAGDVAFVDDAPWPRWLQWFDYDAIGAALERPLVPVVLQPERVRPAQAGGTVAEPTAGAAPPADDLLVENWQPAASGPEKHWSYAVQWFAMAAALTVLFVYVNLRRPPTAQAPTPSIPSPSDDS